MTDADLQVTGPDADELLAMELAAGLLDADARADAERRVATEPSFAELCRSWTARFVTLLEGREEQPPAYVWTAIMRRLPVNDGAGSLRRWQASTGIAASVALALGATLVLRREPAPPPPVERPAPAPVRPLVAVLASPRRDDVVAVSYDPAARRVSALPQRLATGGREAQLWVIPSGGKPVSAGLLTPGARTDLSPVGGVAALMVPGATLAVSLEPRGGSRTGAPTGPVILTGTIARS